MSVGMTLNNAESEATKMNIESVLSRLVVGCVLQMTGMQHDNFSDLLKKNLQAGW